MRVSSVVVLTFIAVTSLLAFQNCGQQNTSSPGLTFGSTGGDAGGTGNPASGCGAGLYNVGGSCVPVDNTHYSPVNNNNQYACPYGSSSAGTQKALLSDCKPVIMFNSNGDCLTSQTTFAGGANPEHVYGCILGAVVDTTQSNPLAKAVSVSGTGPAAVAAALSFMAGSGVTFPTGNMQWQWDPIQKAYRTLHTDPNTGITTLVDLRATFVPTPITLPLQTTNAIQRPDGGYATSDLIFNP